MSGKMVSHTVNRTVVSLNKSIIIILLLWGVPFLNIFNGEHAFININKSLNYAAIILAYVTVTCINIKISLKLFFGVIFFALMITFNVFCGEYASFKWLLNWFGFIFFAFIFITLYLSSHSWNIYERILLRLFYSTITIITIIMVIITFFNYELFSSLLYDYQFNSIIALLKVISIDKQALGNFMGVMLILMALLWRSISLPKKLLLIFFVMAIMPYIIGIRTLWLSLFLVLIWKNIPPKPLMLWLVIFIVPVLAFIILKEIPYDVISYYYDRYPSILAALDIAKNYPFGVGLGGYSSYVKDINESMVANNSLISQEKAAPLWVAPESDIAFFIGSFGWMAIIIYLLYGWILVGGAKIYHSFILSSSVVEKYMLLNSWYYIFMGVSQDNAGTLAWFIAITLGCGIIIKYNSLDAYLRCAQSMQYKNGDD